jgi:hypothetical protein
LKLKDGGRTSEKFKYSTYFEFNKNLKIYEGEQNSIESGIWRIEIITKHL